MNRWEKKNVSKRICHESVVAKKEVTHPCDCDIMIYVHTWVYILTVMYSDHGEHDTKEPESFRWKCAHITSTRCNLVGTLSQYVSSSSHFICFSFGFCCCRCSLPSSLNQFARLQCYAHGALFCRLCRRDLCSRCNAIFRLFCFIFWSPLLRFDSVILSHTIWVFFFCICSLLSSFPHWAYVCVEYVVWRSVRIGRTRGVRTTDNQVLVCHSLNGYHCTLLCAV